MKKFDIIIETTIQIEAEDKYEAAIVANKMGHTVEGIYEEPENNEYIGPVDYVGGWCVSCEKPIFDEDTLCWCGDEAIMCEKCFKEWEEEIKNEESSL